jgi:hypothetical protein
VGEAPAPVVRIVPAELSIPLPLPRPFAPVMLIDPVVVTVA